MYPYLMVATGLYTGRKIALRRNRPTVIGRNEEADYALFSDSAVSSRHLAAVLAGYECEVRDLESSNGVFINDQRIEQATILHPGERLRIGETILVVSSLPVPADSLIEKKELQGKQAAMLAAVEEAPGRLYAILDAAQGDPIHGLLRDSHANYHSLYEGEEGEELAEVAPYLIALPKGSPVTRAIIGGGWGNNWGVFLTAAEGLLDVRRHLRRFLKVESEDGRTLYFRFYDPRILSAFLPTCDAAQWGEFFGPITAFFAQTGDEWRACMRSGPAGA